MQDSTFYSKQSLLYMNTLNYYFIHISVLSEGITGKPKSDKYNINCNKKKGKWAKVKSCKDSK